LRLSILELHADANGDLSRYILARRVSADAETI